MVEMIFIMKKHAGFLNFSIETEDFKPRGCGKLVTKSYQQINFGGARGKMPQIDIFNIGTENKQ